MKNRLQGAGLIERGKRKGRHRKRRPRKPMVGMMIHQDGSTHEWVPGHIWDLIVTLDDATGAVYSGFFVEEEGTLSSFRGLHETIEQHGLFSSFYSDRGSHYWITPETGGKVDRVQLTQFGRALKQLGIEMIAAYSPQARGRGERPFRTLQDRLVKELAEAGITVVGGQYLPEDLLAEVQRSICRSSAGIGFGLCPPSGHWFGGHFVHSGGAHRGGEQLRQLPGDHTADSRAQASLSLRQSEGTRSCLSEWSAGDLPWTEKVGRLPGRWDVD